ncbi:hypothetical protein [Peribacillus simplex]|uniref:hypothetical protein n=1 Tax=Peribacillus simplex TaxID=1478 RepID=UPI0024C10C64|nr:hypothetical protein [Peribacillus simplex]WHY96828.1 hypothetical protein QNH37_23115 [Peribacillus simplex]
MASFFQYSRVGRFNGISITKMIKLFYMDKTLIGLKKFAALLPNNWLEETPQTLALMNLGR